MLLEWWHTTRRKDWRKLNLALTQDLTARIDLTVTRRALPSRGISGVVKHEYRTSRGEVYGFYATDEKKIYIDETVAQPETPLHEYTHMWDDIVREKNPALWKRGVELMEKLGLWNKVEISR